MFLVAKGVLEVAIPVVEAAVAAAAMEVAAEEKSGPCCHGNTVLLLLFHVVCSFNYMSLLSLAITKASSTSEIVTELLNQDEFSANGW